ncbi:testis-expressed protein 2 [Thalassophryne amazonica]|uniref:testis-expressed protein 2 n=1 Tax=Thalassophryne amazonica TaxID=390379 RepID=UPI0014722B1F|nr:testis-expressed protein 2 [Thalassophryne amazonica]
MYGPKMSEGGQNDEREQGDKKESGDGRSLSRTSAVGEAKKYLPQGIVIQLTGTDGEWDSRDDSEVLFSLSHDEDYPSISLSRQRHLSVEEDTKLPFQSFHVPLSPSSPDSFGNCSNFSSNLLSPGPPSPTHQPLSSLVKSLSTELELKEGSSLRPKPLLNLVKSISTEISCSEPEVSQSKSDSRLNLHLWKQLTQPKTRSSGNSHTAPPSPSFIYPSGDGLKGNFFKMELEDTKRKLSEAMQEPLSSMFSKIMREEGAGSPKHQGKTQGAQQDSSKTSGWEGSTDIAGLGSPGKNTGRTDTDFLPTSEWSSVSHPCPLHHGRQHHKDEELKIYSDGEIMQVLAVENHSQIQTKPAGSHVTDPAMVGTSLLSQSTRPLPYMSLFCVAALTYGYFTLPLSPYSSGLALGLACGFLLGLFLIRLGASRTHSSDPPCHQTPTLLGQGILASCTNITVPDTLKGWMSELHEYDPETYHPALAHYVFATLEGSCLRLDSTNKERVHEATIIKSRTFQLAKSKVSLLPLVLAHKRVWNPKYPICIQLAKGGDSLEEEEEEIRGEEPQTERSSKCHSDPFTTLYLFGRTGREKEEWFRHFLFASMDTEREKERASRYMSTPDEASLPQNVSASRHFPNSRGGSSDDDAPSTPHLHSVPTAHATHSSSATKGILHPDYTTYMARLLATEEASPPSSSTETSATIRPNCTCCLAEDFGKAQTAWINALIGRIFWDFLREKHWADVVSCKIQKKLSKIKLPYFMNELTVTEMDLGSNMPQITATSRPEVNQRGLWVGVQMVYTGALQMTLQTKFNLSKLGKDSSQEADYTTHPGMPHCRPVLTVLADSDEESSSAGSSDEEELLLAEPQGPVRDKGPVPRAEGSASGKTRRKILRFVDKIAKSKYFQKATENEFIKKKFEEMSNTPLLLSVEVQELSGTLVINIPPPPTDRIWYSFCVSPKLDLCVRPKLGERELTSCHVTEWIEKKLQHEFQKVFVLPNMDDIYIPLMHSGMDIPQTLQSPSSQSQWSHSSFTESVEKSPPEICGTESD